MKKKNKDSSNNEIKEEINNKINDIQNANISDKEKERILKSIFKVISKIIIDI